MTVLPRGHAPVSGGEGGQLGLPGLRLRRVIQDPLYLLLQLAGLQEPPIVIEPNLEEAAPVVHHDVPAVLEVLDGV